MKNIKFINSIIFVAIVAFGSIKAYAQVNAEQVLAIGKNVLSMEDYMLSIQYFNQAIKAKPYLADPYFYRGLAKLYLEDYKGAESDCTLAIERNKFRTEAYKVRGFARQALGKDSLAIADYNFGLQYAPMDKYFMFYKAIAQSELKDYEAADATYSELLKIYPKFEDGYSARAQLCLERGDTVNALIDVEHALKISKNMVNPYLMRAEVYAKQKQWDKAIVDIDEAIKLRPQEAGLYVNRAYLRYNVDDYFGAMSDYNYAIELEPFNTAAIFNRALLLYEVKDLQRAEVDFSTVLEWDSSNFHARYNRGLVRLELGKYKQALQDFDEIVKRYPRFYPIYYAIAQAEYELGNHQAYFKNVRKADEMVAGYVANPQRNQLDRPTIAAGKSNDRGTQQAENETELDVMNRFNQLITINDSQESRLSYNDKIKGRVQDRDVRIEPEPLYVLTYYDTDSELRSLSNYFRELDELNHAKYLNRTIYLSNDPTTPDDPQEIQRLFDEIENYNAMLSGNNPRPVDYLGRAINYMTIKNYQAALNDLNLAISINPHFAVAYMARAYVRLQIANLNMNQVLRDDNAKDNVDNMLAKQTMHSTIQESIADYDKALQIDSRLIYAWYNKGNMLLMLQDYTSALSCYSEAIKINPNFGQAYYNRGLVYLRMGNKNHGIADLSKAGELGVLPSYNVLKRMQ